MARPKKADATTIATRRSEPPAFDGPDRTNQLVALAEREAERQMREGTASSQIITHFLQLGTVKYQLELEKLKRENRLLETKTNAIEADQSRAERYEEAIQAMQRYKGGGRDEFVDEEY